MKYMGFIEDLRYRTDEYNDSFNTEEENRYPKKQKELWAPKNRIKPLPNLHLVMIMKIVYAY